ncbi:mechanosensitive ion channel domain-containing protein [Thermomonas sp.]|uniref:mechanosensitive ion channel family protein n=1 Tax=Thermomonas sp. TaxID=1971895 RepID=UPI0035AF5550
MRLRVALLACLLAALASPVLQARDSAAPPLPDTGDKAAPAKPASKPTPPAAIAVQDIADRADTDERYAEQVIAVASTAGTSSMKSLDQRLQKIDASTEARGRDFRLDELKLLPAPRLESLERYWAFEARRFEALRRELREASQPYTDAAAELARRRADWDLTRQALAQDGVSQALVERTTGVTALLQDANDRLSAPLERQLALGRRANAVDAQISAGQKAVAAAIAYSDRRLGRIDSPPLWTLEAEQERGKDALDSTRLALDIEFAFLGEYGATNLGNQRALHLFEILLLPMMLWLWWRARRRSREGHPPADPASARVLARPFSTWLLLSMLAMLVLEPDAPLLIHQFAMLVALVPLLRLLPPHSKEFLGPWPYVASALYLLNRLAFLLLGNLFLYRWYHFGLTVLALGLMAWLAWRARKVDVADLRGYLGPILQGAAWFAVLVLAIAATSNMFGNLTLAEMLTSGLIDSGYMALVVYAGITVFIALLGQLLPKPDGHGLRVLRTHAPQILHVASRAAALAGALGWLFYTANRFRIYRPIHDTVERIVTASIEVGEIELSLGSLLVFVLGLVLAVTVARLVRFLLREQVLPTMSLPRGVDNSIASLTYYALLFVGLLAALAAAGFQIGQLTFLFGAMGVGIGLGLQDVVKNFVSGLILMFERPVQPGDVVDVSGTSGRVGEIGMRATTIRTFDGADVVVPNGMLLADKFTNWTLHDQHRRIDVAVGVAYGSDPERVAALLLEVVKGTPGMVDVPAPAVLFSGFGASSLDFAVRGWTHDFDNWPSIRSQLATRLYAALVQAGIEIPFPQQDLHLRSVSDEVARRLRGPDDAAAATPA